MLGRGAVHRLGHFVDEILGQRLAGAADLLAEGVRRLLIVVIDAVRVAYPGIGILIVRVDFNQLVERRYGVVFLL